MTHEDVLHTGNPVEFDRDLARRFADDASRNVAYAQREIEALQLVLAQPSTSAALIALGRAQVVEELVADDLESVSVHLRSSVER